MFLPQAAPTRATLEQLAKLVQEGVITPVIEQTFDLEDADAALRHLETDHARAKVVVSMGVGSSNS